MMQVYENCIHFIRTIATLVVNPNNPEDIESDSEDHVADESALLCMARPMKMGGKKFIEEIEVKKPPKDISEVAYRELQNIWEQNNGEYQWSY